MRKPDVVVKEYVSRLSDDDLYYLNVRLSQRLYGDLPASLEFMSKSSDMDRWLGSAKSSDDFFERIESLSEFVEREAKKRSAASRDRKKERYAKVES